MAATGPGEPRELSGRRGVRKGRGVGIRARVAIVVVALVALTATVLGIGASAFVDASLRDQFRADALRQADYDLGVLIPTALPRGIDRASLTASGLLETFRLRGDVETIVDFGDGDPVVSSFDLVGALAGLPPELRPIADRGEIGYAWTSMAGRSALVLAGRPAAGDPVFFFVHDASDIERALTQLRIALLVGSLVFAAGNSTNTFILLKASSVGFGYTGVILVYVLYNLTYASGSLPLGSLSDRIGQFPVVIGGFVVFAIVYAGFAAAKSAALVAVLFAAYGLYIAATEGTSKALISRAAPDEERASAMGFYDTAVGVATFVASTLGGILWSTVGPWATFAYGAACAGVAAAIMLAARGVVARAGANGSRA